ncbi:hypothetical protein SASPL_113358 [Salvia splendens]|uniref:Plastocyanin-like domain-containing protein n=1 Tax=Salvia splendens TaxID=180675 RepID=A0A8X8Y3J9_SALSN|nr:hypothetical protein SASPL_113358 [Salvia splendens]
MFSHMKFFIMCFLGLVFGEVNAVRFYKFEVISGPTVEIVFQGTILGEGIDHPIHLHGYSFYVLSSGLGNFDGVYRPNLNLVDLPFMDTTVSSEKRMI